jgi:hypothetical protein
MKLDTLKPDQVVAWIRKHIREIFGNYTEDQSNVYARNGFYYVFLFRNKRRGKVKYSEYTVRRKNLPKLMKELKSERH